MPAEFSERIEEKRELVGRVAESSLFQKSPRLREFLLYVAECTLSGFADGAREQVIAERVFKRKPDYATQDSIVRAEARNLRKRLEAYFATDGKDESTIIEMPRGKYLLTFRARDAGTAAPLAVSGVDSPAAPLVASTAVTVAAEEIRASAAATAIPRRHEGGAYRGLSAALAVIAVAATISAVRYYRTTLELRSQIPSISHSLPLSAIFANSLDTLIITSDVTLVPFFFSERHRVSLNDYITRSYPLVHHPFSVELVRKGVYTDGQEMAIAGEFLRANARHAGHVSLRSGHQIQLSDLKDHNLLMLGSAYSNPWGQMFEDKLNFRLELGAMAPALAAHVSPGAGKQDAYPCNANIVVHDLSPRPGGPAVYPCYDGHRSYAVIAFIPGESPMGNVLWIEGTTAEATAAAGEFLVDEDQTRQTLKSAGINPYGPPRFFEFLMKATSFVGGATQAEVVATRVRPAQRP